MSEPRIEVPATCEIHGGTGRLVVRRDGDRLMLDGNADHCCMFSLDYAAVVALFDVVAVWLG
ncbi:MAG: hypothetical protein JO272_14375 [Pseudonocardiales bacterium]|nr:hypothetical protein [Pseudonocardiales bacterium]